MSPILLWRRRSSEADAGGMIVEVEFLTKKTLTKKSACEVEVLHGISQYGKIPFVDIYRPLLNVYEDYKRNCTYMNRAKER